MTTLLTRYADKIVGTIGCYDRVIIQGSVHPFCYAQGMTDWLDRHDTRIFDFPRFAEPLRDEIRANAEQIAAKEKVEIEFVRKIDGFSKEDRVAQIVKRRGNHAGLVHIFSAMESCATYKPWHDKMTGRTFLRPDTSRCLHYYFYFIDPQFGLCYLRVPTWVPFRLQFYFNGHNWLAASLDAAGISSTMQDNAFVEIEDWSRAQELSDSFQAAPLHKLLDRLARRYCPPIAKFLLGYHWTIMQAEYATDIVFRKQSDLKPVYEAIVRTAIHSVHPDSVASFLGHRIPASRALGTDFSTRIEGTRIKHYLGKNSIKMYDKFGRILRIETTTNDPTFFKHLRKVVQRDGQTVTKLAPLRKTIYSLAPDLAGLLAASNQRYLDFLDALDDPTPGAKDLDRISRSETVKDHAYRGFSFFNRDDQNLFEILLRGEFNITGLRNKNLRSRLAEFSSAQISRLIKRLRIHGLIKKIGGSYKYYLTALGKRVLVAGLRLKEMFLVPTLTAA